MQKKKEYRYFCVFAFLLAILLLLLLGNLCYGSVSFSLRELCSLLLGNGNDSTLFSVLWQIRLPRILSAVFLGGALSVSGFLLQTFFGNPIAGPYVLGISSGAKLFVALLMIFFLRLGMQMSALSMVIAAFLGSMLAMAFVLLISVKVSNMSLLIVCGIMIGYICSAITDFLVTYADDSNIVNLHNWSLGSFSGSS